MKKLELSTNRIKQAGAVALARGLIVILKLIKVLRIFFWKYLTLKFSIQKSNFVLEEINLSNNSFGVEGAVAISECIKYNKVLQSIDLTNNRLNHDAVKCIAESLKQNSTLESLNVKEIIEI